MDTGVRSSFQRSYLQCWAQALAPSRHLWAISWPTEQVKYAQPVRLRVRNLLLKTAFLNIIWAGLGSAFFLILYQDFASSLILASPRPSMKHISLPPRPRTDHCSSQPRRWPRKATHLPVPALWCSLLHGTMLLCICICVTRSILKKWQYGRSCPKVRYKRLLLSLSHHSLRKQQAASLSWGALGKAYMVRKWSHLLKAMWVNLEVESNPNLTATLWECASQNSRATQLSSSWPLEYVWMINVCRLNLLTCGGNLLHSKHITNAITNTGKIS